MVTVVTKTIGPTGRDYSTFTLAEAAVESIATAEFGGTDLVTGDGAIVFEADAGTYAESVIIDHALACDPTRNVTFQSAAGGQAIVASATLGTVIQVTRGPFTTFRNLKIASTGTSTSVRGVEVFPASGRTCEGCLFDGLTLENNGSVHFTAIELQLESSAASGGAGSAAHPTIIQNCVELGDGNGFGFVGGKVDSIHAKVVNCTLAGSGIVAFSLQTANDLTVEVVNCINLSHQWTFRDNFTTGAVTATGSNNFGGSSNPFPAALQGSPYPITATTSFSTPLGAGDYAVYMGATGALADKTGNDVWNQGVGPSANASVPTTDINGVARSGANCNPGAFEADGFVAPTITTQTIGPTGRDYATFTLAEASLPAEDITFTNRAFVFEADAGTYAESVAFLSSLTSDATRNVTYKAAAGSEHGGVRGAGVNIEDSSTAYGSVVEIRDSFLVLEGLCIQATNGSSGSRTACDLRPIGSDLEGIQLRGVILSTGSARQVLGAFSGNSFGSVTSPFVVENCVLHRDHAATAVNFPVTGTDVAYAKFINVTCAGVTAGSRFFNSFVDASASIHVSFVNCLNTVQSSVRFIGSGSNTVTGSNNFGGSSEAFPAAVQGSPYPITASTAYDPGAGDFALYVGKNGALLDSPHNDVIDGGVGPASNSDVPTTDILGDTRSGTTTNPGAFALAQATAVLTKTIGPVGRDYATFTAAEADVENIGGSADLVFENERIEFEADAATYDEEVNWQSSLTTDATRNVTYKPAAGSEHGGVFGAGVVLLTSGASYGSTQTIRDSFLTLDGIECHANNTSSFRYALTLGLNSDLLGATVRNCLIWSQTKRACFQSAGGGSYDQGSAAAPIVFKNCVLRSTDNVKDMLIAYERPGYEMYLRAINCTFIGDAAGNHRAFAVGGTSTTNLEFSNNLITVPAGWYQGSSTPTVTGGSNFAGSSQVLPAAIQGSPYPITATTNTTPGFGDYAIYNASTGALIVVDDNAALGGGVGPAANADVPVLDILGVRRIGGGCDPGAFEGVRSRSTDVWDVVAARHTTPGSFGELMQQMKIAVTSLAASRLSS